MKAPIKTFIKEGRQVGELEWSAGHFLFDLGPLVDTILKPFKKSSGGKSADASFRRKVRQVIEKRRKYAIVLEPNADKFEPLPHINAAIIDMIGEDREKSISQIKSKYGLAHFVVDTFIKAAGSTTNGQPTYYAKEMRKDKLGISVPEAQVVKTTKRPAETITTIPRGDGAGQHMQIASEMATPRAKNGNARKNTSQSLQVSTGGGGGKRVDEEGIAIKEVAIPSVKEGKTDKIKKIVERPGRVKKPKFQTGVSKVTSGGVDGGDTKRLREANKKQVAHRPPPAAVKKKGATIDTNEKPQEEKEDTIQAGIMDHYVDYQKTAEDLMDPLLKDVVVGPR